LDYVYNGLGWLGAFGGSAWCLFSLAFRWRTITHKYGRIDLYFWVIYIQCVVCFMAYAAMWAVYAIQRTIANGIFG
jgi:hypothetical protein